jgi:hypothetical protein
MFDHVMRCINQAAANGQASGQANEQASGQANGHVSGQASGDLIGQAAQLQKILDFVGGLIAPIVGCRKGMLGNQQQALTKRTYSDYPTAN